MTEAVMTGTVTTGALLPELTVVSCEACSGEGYLMRAEPNADTYDERPQPCDVCGGSGELEVCSGCSEVPVLEYGVEVCGCVALPLKRVA